jgi:hypothetical protein
MTDEWFVYRHWIDDRIYHVVRTEEGRLRVGWLRADGEQFGGYLDVFRRWLITERSYIVSKQNRLI